jgi:GntR family transcriptional regulator
MSVRPRAQRVRSAGDDAGIGLKHERVAAVLAREIRSGEVPRWTRLPGELALAQRFAVSRNTVREALAELSEAGLIATRSGKGSFVVFDGNPLDHSAGWARALPSNGSESTGRLVAIRREHDPALAAVLGLDGPDLFVVERTEELADGERVAYERSTIAAIPALADLPERGLEDGSLTQTLALAGIIADHGDQHMRCVPLDDEQALLVRRRPGVWFLHSIRTSFTRDGRFAERVESLLDPAHFDLHLRFGERA